MDFQSAMETFAEAWVAANTKVDPVQMQHRGDTTERVKSFVVTVAAFAIPVELVTVARFDCKNSGEVVQPEETYRLFSFY
ncbi:hypothetical protein KQX54_005947 [Cotesia glomerata]|uniref:Uncharacterized protein n=1 Tax=Cotesia glomerata TaxID=32391 RepID=A0AAV7J5X4_COTGL|nr:hypothetical protein KQX54_005947 [Cotesia glomerata]